MADLLCVREARAMVLAGAPRVDSGAYLIANIVKKVEHGRKIRSSAARVEILKPGFWRADRTLDPRR